MMRTLCNLRILPLTILFIASMCLLGIREAQADLVVVPNYVVDNQPDGPGGDLREILREQLVYGASEFPPYPIIITDIRWRPDLANGGPTTTIISNIQISLSTTLKSADQLSTTFSENLGTNNTVVFSGAMNVASSFITLTNGTKAFDIDLPLQTSFLYDPFKGNLLLDIRNFTGCNILFYDNVVGNDSDTVSRIFSLGNPNATGASFQDSAATIIEIGYLPAPLPPVVDIQPTNQTGLASGTTTITTAIIGSPPLNYQWFFSDTNTPIDGATNASLVLTNLQLNQQGNYFLKVTNSFGQTYSSNVLLTIIARPVIILQPTSQTVPLGSIVFFPLHRPVLRH